MKIKLIYLTFFILFINFCSITSTAKAESTDDYNWDRYIDAYTQSQIQKAVTPQEYDKALTTINNFSKKKKKRKKKSKKGKSNDESQDSRGDNSYKNRNLVSADPLLRLPISVFCNNQVIDKGFYLVSFINKNNNYYIVLKQGNDNPIEIEASTISVQPISPPSKKKRKNKRKKKKKNFIAETGITEFGIDENNNLSIMYSGKGVFLRTHVIAIPEKPIGRKKNKLKNKLSYYNYHYIGVN